MQIHDFCNPFTREYVVITFDAFPKPEEFEKVAKIAKRNVVVRHPVKNFLQDLLMFSNRCIILSEPISNLLCSNRISLLQRHRHEIADQDAAHGVIQMHQSFESRGCDQVALGVIRQSVNWAVDALER